MAKSDKIYKNLEDGLVAYLIYQDHTIVSSAVYDVVIGKWKLASSVSSQYNGERTRRLHIVKNSPELFSPIRRRRKAGMEAAKSWVDLTKRGGPFPLATVPARYNLWR